MPSYCRDCVNAKLEFDETGLLINVSSCCPDICEDSWNDCVNYKSVFAAAKKQEHES